MRFRALLAIVTSIALAGCISGPATSDPPRTEATGDGMEHANWGTAIELRKPQETRVAKPPLPLSSPPAGALVPHTGWLVPGFILAEGYGKSQQEQFLAGNVVNVGGKGTSLNLEVRGEDGHVLCTALPVEVDAYGMASVYFEIDDLKTCGVQDQLVPAYFVLTSAEPVAPRFYIVETSGDHSPNATPLPVFAI